MSISKDEIKQYLAMEGQRLDNDVVYWQEEMRKYPLSSVAASLQLAFVRRETFNSFCRSLSALLDLDCF